MNNDGRFFVQYEKVTVFFCRPGCYTASRLFGNPTSRLKGERIYAKELI